MPRALIVAFLLVAGCEGCGASPERATTSGPSRLEPGLGDEGPAAASESAGGGPTRIEEESVEPPPVEPPP